MADGTLRETVDAFFDCVARADIDGLAVLLHEDLDWLTMGGELFAFSGRRDKAEVVEAFRGITSLFPETGLVLRIMNVIQEGDRIAFEAEGHAALANGLIYNNVYHIQVWFRDGLISVVREHMDTLYAKTVLIDGKAVPPAY